MMNAKTKLDKALVTITTEPQLAFWAGLSIQIPKIMDESIPTAATNGEKIFFNPQFLNTLSNGQIIFVILHELLHIIREDVIRIGDRDIEDWNKAADIVINDMLKQMRGKVEPIEDAIYPENELVPLKGQSSEWNYCWLKNNKNKLKKVRSYDSLLKNSKIQKNPIEYKNRIKRMVQSAIQISSKDQNSLDNLPSTIKDWIIQLITPKIDWRIVLQEFLGSAIKQDWSWNKPHTSILLNSGCIAPTINKTPKISNVVILLDSSSSVSDNDLLQFWGEIVGMSNIIEKLTIAHFTIGIDAIDIYNFNTNNIKDIIPSQRYEGGTSIPGALQDLMEKITINEIDSPEIVIIFSDMESLLPEKEFPVPTLWVALNNKNFKAPFGTQINID